MKTILVPCDFSKPAINAFRLALDIAERSNGNVKLVHIIELPVMHDTVLMPVLNFEEALLKELREKASVQFKKLSDKYEKGGIKVTTEIAFGNPIKTILEIISKEWIDLVVMGSHGASGLREYFIGSNAEKIIRQSPVPVLITKNYNSDPVKNIVFPNTLEIANQDELVEKVVELQEFFNAHLQLVWVNTTLNFTSDIVTNQRLNKFAKHFNLKNCSLHIFNHPTEEEGIIRFAQHAKGDLIAMGTHSRKGFAHFLNGSVAEDVANHTDSLIWTYTLKPQSAES